MHFEVRAISYKDSVVGKHWLAFSKLADYAAGGS